MKTLLQYLGTRSGFLEKWGGKTIEEIFSNPKYFFAFLEEIKELQVGNNTLLDLIPKKKKTLLDLLEG